MKRRLIDVVYPDEMRKKSKLAVKVKEKKKKRRMMTILFIEVITGRIFSPLWKTRAIW